MYQSLAALLYARSATNLRPTRTLTRPLDPDAANPLEHSGVMYNALSIGSKGLQNIRTHDIWD